MLSWVGLGICDGQAGPCLGWCMAWCIYGKERDYMIPLLYHILYQVGIVNFICPCKGIVLCEKL